jgi:ElaB/YqjD/DUF883 family membrane-anchored ribosome-binding protein
MATTEATKQVDTIKSDLDALRTDLTALMDDMAQLRKTAASDARAHLDDRLADISARASRTRDTIATTTTEQVETARKTVQENPITSVAAAFGLGLVVSRLIK